MRVIHSSVCTVFIHPKISPARILLSARIPHYTQRHTCVLSESVGVAIHLSLRASLFNAGLAAQSLVKVSVGHTGFVAAGKISSYAKELFFEVRL